MSPDTTSTALAWGRPEHGISTTPPTSICRASTESSVPICTDLVDNNDGDGYALSTESGRSIAMGAGDWTLTPQAQLIWSSVDFDSFDCHGRKGRGGRHR
ncbi:autotransporter domain-containing protein [Halomonas cupida]|uniref:autotransporter domain-containing protein n=1 Tax=Halomonas cupida TaxID=44933 RepID=UPI0009363176